MKKLAAAIMAIMAVVTLHGQTVDSCDVAVEVTLNGGYMMPNNSQYSAFNSATYGMDLTYWKRDYTGDYWRWKRGFPSVGIRFSYAHIPNSVAGDRFGLVSLLGGGMGTRWNYSVGLGLSAYTRPRSITGDTNNIFIGSLFNCLIDLGLTYRPMDDLLMTFRILHTSNGMLKWPNMGLNYLQLDIGYRIPVKEFNGVVITEEPSYPRDYAPREWSVALSLGTVMSRDREFAGYYPCYDLSVYYQKNISPTFSFGGAVDFWYNAVDRCHILREDGVYRMPLYLSALGMMEFRWGHMSLKTGIGAIVLGSFQVTNPIYERVGGYYNFGRNYLGVAMNAHAGRIEFIEWTYGRRFPIR